MSVQKWNFRHENQLGSLIGVTDFYGDRTAEIDYGEYGQTFAKAILWDGPVDVANTQSVGGLVTRVYTLPGFLFGPDMENGLLRCVPGYLEPVSFGTVMGAGVDTVPGPTFGQSYIDVEDLEGRVINAIKEVGCDVVVFANYGQVVPVPQAVTSGHWDDITYDSMTDTTTFTDFGQAYPPAAIDYWLQPDASKSVYLDIVNIGVGQVIVAGNATFIANGIVTLPGPPPESFIGSFYTIVWPVGVDPGSGTLAHNDPCNPASRVLFAGYYYMPPVAGTLIAPPPVEEASYEQPVWQLMSSKYRPAVSTSTASVSTLSSSNGSNRPLCGPGIQLTAINPPAGVYGQQPGPNLRGDYYCWNRIYDPNIGRWTSPDPAASPWRNLLRYAPGSPLGMRDPSGLKSFNIEDSDCSITMSFMIAFHFYDRGALTWTTATEKDYMKKVKSLIEAAWNDKIVLKPAIEDYEVEGLVEGWEADEECGFKKGLVPGKYTVSCPCQEGYKVKVKLRYVHGKPNAETEQSVDVHADVTRWPAKGSPGYKQHISNADTSKANLDDEDDIRTITTGTDYQGNPTTTVPVAHEFGHMFGLHHPCKGQQSNPNCYDAKGNFSEYYDPVNGGMSTSIMGGGSEVLPEHVGVWKDYLDSERSDCGPFTASKK